MSNEQLYISVEKNATAEICEKKSRFIANICHTETEESAMEFVEKIRKESRRRMLLYEEKENDPK